MTLTNAFRARSGGVLLCADREETDGYSRTEVDKIYQILGLKECEVFITGAGPSEIIGKVNAHIHQSFTVAEQGGVNLLAEHVYRIEGSLKYIYKEYAKTLAMFPMALIIVIAPRAPKSTPIIYSTGESCLKAQPLYCAHGSGRPISDYLADRLYKHGMENKVLTLLSAFIFREAERKAAGVGMGTDMLYINDGDITRRWIDYDTVKKLQEDIPQLSESLRESWNKWPAITAWLEEQ